MTEQRSPASHLVAGALGGLIAVVIGAILIAADVIDTGDDGNDGAPAPQAQTERPQADDGGSSGKTVNEIYRETDAGVAFISARRSGDSSQSIIPQERGRATGSGFALDREGYVLTNAHVVEDATSVTVRFGDEAAVEAKIE